MPHVLIVEDNEHIRRIYSSKLQAEGFKVTIAEDGEQGLLWAEVCVPDAILLDIMMPKMDGFEVLKRLRDHPHLNGIPVFMLSNKAWADDVHAALSLGAREFFTKGSATLQNIVTHIRNACGFKKLVVITATAAAGKPIAVALQHPKVLCGSSTVLAEAVAAVERRQPDLVVFDARSADANVFAILQQLKTTPATQRIPIIAITDEPQKFHHIDGSVGSAQIDRDLRLVIFKLLGLAEPVEAAPVADAQVARSVQVDEPAS